MSRSEYIGEFRRNWAPLAAAAVGLSGGTTISSYAQSVIAPTLIADFGWTRSEYAALGAIGIIALLLIPLSGRLTDLWGTRRIMVPALILYPFAWLLYLAGDGTFRTHIIIASLHLIVGCFTTSVVYSRIVAEYFVHARGLALSVVMSGPAAVAAVGSPYLSRLVGEHGWQPGYVAMAAFSAATGAIAYGLLQVRSPGIPNNPLEARKSRSLSDYRLVFTSRTFWIIFLALALCNIPNVLHASQMKLMLLDRGADAASAATIISVYAVGVLIGRFGCGLALDRLPVEPVAVVSMMLPAVGLFLLGANLGDWHVMAFSMLLVGLSQGAEGDIGAILTLKYFDVNVYGTVFGLIASNAVFSTVLGTLILSATLSFTEDFTLFLYIGGTAILVGSMMLALLTRVGPDKVGAPQASLQ